jgi:hypothetical protein
VDRTGLGPCPMVDFCISSFETLGSATRGLANFELCFIVPVTDSNSKEFLYFRLLY